MLNVKEFMEKYGETHMRGNHNYYLVNSEEEHNLNNTYEGYILDAMGRVQEYAFGTGRAPEFTEEQEEDDSDEGIAFRMAEYERVSDDRLWFGETLDKYYPWPYYPDKTPVAVRLNKDIALPAGVLKEGTVFPVVHRYYVEPNPGVVYSLPQIYGMPHYFQPIYGTE